MSLLNRHKARAIVCEAFNSFTDLHLEPTSDRENAVIQKTLQTLSDKFVIAIYELIKGGVKKLKCSTALGIGGFVTARYVTIGDVVDDLIASSTCP